VVSKTQGKSIFRLACLNSLKDRGLYLVSWLGICMCIPFLLASCKAGLPPESPVTAQPANPNRATDTKTPQLQVPEILFTPTLEPEQPINSETKLYAHPQGLFSLEIPDDWSVTHNENTASFENAGRYPSIHVEVVNTGYPLDTHSMANFIEIREKGMASDYENYVELDRRKVSETGAILLTKQILDHSNREMMVTSYQQDGPAVLVLDFLAEQDTFERYQSILDTLTDSVQVSPDAISRLSVYSFNQAKPYSNGLINILVPPYWNTRQVQGENTVIDTITSPDDQAVIQMIAYDDGMKMSRNIAGDLVLALLRENYTKGITVLVDEVLANGREKLTWRATNNNYQGVVTFETRESALLMVTIIWGNDPKGYYQNILEEILNSYTVVDSGNE
jgi:hypothetical protein